MRAHIEAVSLGISPNSAHGRAWLSHELDAHGSDGLCNYENDTMPSTISKCSAKRSVTHRLKNF